MAKHSMRVSVHQASALLRLLLIVYHRCLWSQKYIINLLNVVIDTVSTQKDHICNRLDSPVSVGHILQIRVPIYFVFA